MRLDFYGISTWKGCREFKKFVIEAVHSEVCGFAVVPYRLVFLNFNCLIDHGSDQEDDNTKESLFVQVAMMILDWIVEKPLRAAFDKHAGENPKSTSVLQKLESRARKEQELTKESKCAECQQTGHRGEGIGPFVATAVWYAITGSRSCQKRGHWQVHKKECADLQKQILQMAKERERVSPGC
jgi:hypothetical protein